MENVSGYILSVIAGAMILGILQGICSKAPLLRLAGGLFLTFVILQPLAEFDFSDITDFMEAYSDAGVHASALGESMGDETYRSVIKAEVETYILDKAETLGAQLRVEVMLGENAIPESVQLRGNISPYARARLVQMMETDLGIARENQLWIG